MNTFGFHKVYTSSNVDYVFDRGKGEVGQIARLLLLSSWVDIKFRSKGY